MTREERTELYRRGVNETMVESRAAETYRGAGARHAGARDARAGARLARLAKGSKALVLVSDGFILDPAARRLQERRPGGRRVNVTIYFVNTRGLKGLGGPLRVDVVSPS
jgi:hypothetical protein